MITIRIGEQLFALDIMAVREIRGWANSTPLPESPSYVLGMINLRGAVLPVIDLGSRIGLSACAPGPTSVVLVVDIGGRSVGLCVDAVCDIITLRADTLQPVPDIGGSSHLITGVIASDQGIVGILALDDILPETVLAA
jgi:purine-binding chemotaxis protein CheW